MSDSNALKSFVNPNQRELGCGYPCGNALKLKNSLSFLHFQLLAYLKYPIGKPARHLNLTSTQQTAALVEASNWFSESEVPELKVLARLWLVMAHGQPQLPQTVFVKCRPLVVSRVTLSAAWGGLSTGHPLHHCSRG